MKRMYIIPLIIIVVIGLLTFLYLYLKNTGKELKISFITEQEHTSKDLEYNGFLNHFDWVILSSEGQKKNWENEGYTVPLVDFSKNYLIISRYKILKLYRKTGNNECLGVPDGEVVFDKKNSDKDFYYFYLMPRVMLSQGVG